MDRPFLFLTTLAVLILFGGQSIAKNQKPSEEMIRILIHHKTGSILSPQGLAEDGTMNVPSPTELPEYEVYRVPNPGEGAFSVYLHIKSEKYWIRAVGGAAGSDTFYGPGLIKDLPKPKS
ncbi:hypothetical protein [Prosthecobacter sp.]|uniref:hypothetical protein n=1 Tax=Prosthecobacter sp. TaxID=1965333 RepID=UPI0037850857